jgi:hypothetical protein
MRSDDQELPRRSVRPGDSLYYHGPGGVGHAPVLCAGKHGVTLDIDGQPTAVRWQHVLGHRERVSYPARIVDAGEDGAIVEEDDGTRAYIEGLAKPEPEPEPEPETAWGSLMKSETAYLFFVKAAGTQVANRPGLSLQTVSSKRGGQVKRWKRTSEEQSRERPHAAAKPGASVQFAGGAGQVVASGADGVTIRDQAGKEHQVRHGDYRPHRGEGQGAERREPKRPEWAPREHGEVDKAYAKRVIDKGDSPEHLPEDHGRYFNEVAGMKVVSLNQLRSSKSDEENAQGGDNGPKRMLAAYHGVLSKRDPITVTANGSGGYDIVDGNGTYTSAKRLGWGSLPVKVVDAAEAKRMKDAEAAKEAAKSQASGTPKPKQPRKFFEPGEVERLPHKDTVTQSVFSDWASASALAPSAHQEYTSLLKSMGDTLGFVPGKGAPDAMSDEDLESDQAFIFMGPVKKQDKSTAKVTNDYKGDWTKLKDLVRATISVKSIGDVHAALDGLKQVGLQFAQKPKDNMTHGMVEGYRDLNLILKLPKTGMLVELQIAVKQISKVKGEAHEFYNANIQINERRKQAIRAGGQSAGAMRVGEPVGGYDVDNPYDERNWPDKDDWKAFSHNVKRQQVIYNGAWAKVPGLDLIAKALRSVILFFRRTRP